MTTLTKDLEAQQLLSHTDANPRTFYHSITVKKDALSANWDIEQFHITIPNHANGVCFTTEELLDMEDDQTIETDGISVTYNDARGEYVFWTDYGLGVLADIEAEQEA